MNNDVYNVGLSNANLSKKELALKEKAQQKSKDDHASRMRKFDRDSVKSAKAKKKLEEQRYELKQFLMFTHGSKSWDELLQMEGQIRKRRQKEIYDRQIFKQKVITVIVLIICVIVGMGILLSFIYGLMQLDQGNIG